MHLVLIALLGLLFLLSSINGTIDVEMFEEELDDAGVDDDDKRLDYPDYGADVADADVVTDYAADVPDVDDATPDDVESFLGDAAAEYTPHEQHLCAEKASCTKKDLSPAPIYPLSGVTATRRLSDEL